MAADSASTTAIDRRQILISFVISTAAALAPRALQAAARVTATAADWQSVIETMFPHPDIDRSLYRVTADALSAAGTKDTSTAQVLADGWTRLAAMTEGTWHEATAERRIAALAAIVASPLFALVRQTVVFTFYGNPSVWKEFGYEGDAWRFGGYAARNLVGTIDWVPNPPGSEEHSGVR